MPRVVPPIDGRTSGNQSLNPSFVESVAGFSAGVVATLVVHPFDILKTRLQLDQRNTRWGSSWKILRKIVRDEGNVTALYRGIMPNMIGNSVSWALYFLWYVPIPYKRAIWMELIEVQVSEYQGLLPGAKRAERATFFERLSTGFRDIWRFDSGLHKSNMGHKDTNDIYRGECARSVPRYNARSTRDHEV